MEMQITINGIIFHSDKNIEIFPILIDELNYRLILKKLESERNKIINYLKRLKSKGEIKSIFRPKNNLKLNTKLLILISELLIYFSYHICK